MSNSMTPTHVDDKGPADAGAAQNEFGYLAGPDEVAMHIELIQMLQECRELDPNWFELLEQTDTETCERAELVELILTAPNTVAKLFLFGKYEFRLAVASVTGRGFK
jgi:hypothetical protein